MRRREDLSRPRRGRLSLGIHYDPDAFGEFSEGIARFLGTARFLVVQTCLVVVWISLNVVWISLRQAAVRLLGGFVGKAQGAIVAI